MYSLSLGTITQVNLEASRELTTTPTAIAFSQLEVATMKELYASSFP